MNVEARLDELESRINELERKPTTKNVNKIGMNDQQFEEHWPRSRLPQLSKPYEEQLAKFAIIDRKVDLRYPRFLLQARELMNSRRTIWWLVASVAIAAIGTSIEATIDLIDFFHRR